MTSKNLFFKLMKEDIKRRIWLVSLLMLVFVFTYPVAVMAMMGEAGGGNFTGTIIAQRQAMLSQTYSYFGPNNGFICFLMTVSAVVCAISSFSYLFSRKQTDFYHAVPVKRQNLFWSHYIDGILVVAVTFLVNLLAACLIAAVNGADIGKMLALSSGTFAVNMLYFMLMYSVVVVAVMLTGTMMISLLGTAVFFGYGPLTLFLLEGYFSTWFHTFAGFETDGIMRMLQIYTSPFGVYMADSSELFRGNRIGNGIAALAASALFAALSMWLYKRRPSEAAGKAMAFEKSKIIIKIAITVVSSFVICILFWQIRSTTMWGIFGIVVGGVFVHCLMEIIYHADFRALFCNKLHLLVCVLAGIFIFCGFRYDVVGYDRYLPKKETVKEASVYINDLDNWVTYGKAEENVHNRYYSDAPYYWSYESPSSYVEDHMKITDIDTILAAARQGMENKQNYANYYTNMIIKYRLNSGRTVTRSYQLALYEESGENDAIIKQLYGNNEYKNGLYPILSQTVEETASVYYQEVNHIMPVPTADQEEMGRLLNAYQQDLTELSIDDLKSESPVGMIQFRTLEQEGAILANKGVDGLEQRCYYPVYPSFERTAGLLATYGIAPGKRVLPESITQISITDNWSDSVRTFNFTDKDVLEALYPSLVYHDYANLNEWNQMCSGYYATVSWGKGMNQYTYEYDIDEDKMPDWLVEQIGYEPDEDDGYFDRTTDFTNPQSVY